MLMSLILFFPVGVSASTEKTVNFGDGVTAKYRSEFDDLVNKRSWTPTYTDYTSKSESPAEVFHNLRKANQTVPVLQTAKVPKKTVLKNLLGKAIAGGHLAAGLGSGPVGWALTAATA